MLRLLYVAGVGACLYFYFESELGPVAVFGTMVLFFMLAEWLTINRTPIALLFKSVLLASISMAVYYAMNNSGLDKEADLVVELAKQIGLPILLAVLAMRVPNSASSAVPRTSNQPAE
jgi:hypothetical protein